MEIHNVAFNDKQKVKPKINITTKGPSRKQVIIPMSEDYWSKCRHSYIQLSIGFLSYTNLKY